MTARSLIARGVSAGYGEVAVIRDLSFAIAQGRITAIVGPNACGKSTLLRCLSRLLRPTGGQVLLDRTSVHRIPPRELARQLGLLPQSPLAPDGITVADLVSRGRHPHQGFLARWTRADDEAVAAALEATATADLADHLRDRPAPTSDNRFVWIAAEQELVRKARARFRNALGVGLAEGYFAHYWTA